MGHGCPVSNGSGNYHYVYEKSYKYPIEASGIVDVCTPAFLIYAVVRTLRMYVKQLYHPISNTATSLTFVPVGPVIISPLVSFNAL